MVLFLERVFSLLLLWITLITIHLEQSVQYQIMELAPRYFHLSAFDRYERWGVGGISCEVKFKNFPEHQGSFTKIQPAFLTKPSLWGLIVLFQFKQEFEWLQNDISGVMPRFAIWIKPGNSCWNRKWWNEDHYMYPVFEKKLSPIVNVKMSVMTGANASG